MNRRAFLLGAATVLLGSLVTIALRAFAEAAFLGAYGPKQMPWLLIANATGFAVATLGYDAITRVARAAVVDLALLVILALAAAAAPTLLAHGAPPVVLVVALAAASQVAGLALWNRVCAAVAGRDARRYLPRAGAAVTAGGAIAGLGAGAMIPRLGLAAIPYIGAGVTLLVLALAVAQERALATGGAPGGAPATTNAPAALTAVQRSLVAAMLAVAALEGIVGTLIDLQFLGRLRAHYTGDDLAIALALFYGGTNAVLFVLQSAAVPHLLVTRAMTFTAAIHPLLVVLSYAGFVAAPGFLGIAATRTADQVLRFATSRTSQEAELSALPPAPRARYKVLLRGAVWPAGTAAAALALLAIGPSALRAPTALAGIAIAIAIVWAIAARIAARRFQIALAAPLGIRRARSDAHRIDLDTLEAWTHAAGADDPKQAALARAALARVRVDATDLADHLRHDEPAVRAALFDQLARVPAPALRGELRAAVGIEDDDRALALGIKALAIARDEAGIVRGKARAGLSREVDAAVRTAELMLASGATGANVGRGGTGAASANAGATALELQGLLARDPSWAAAFARAQRAELPDPVLDEIVRAALARPDARHGAYTLLAHVGPATSRMLLAQALDDGDAEALAAITDIDRDGAAYLIGELASFSTTARAAIARALAGAADAGDLLGRLVDDADPEVAYAALRSALGFARGGGVLAADRIVAAYEAALAALVAHLDARDVVAGASAPNRWSPCAKQELDIATRRCVARVLCAAAIEAAAEGRDPAPIAATARHLIGGAEADRKRALDVVQELQARPELLVAIERWLRPAASASSETGIAQALSALDRSDPWLGRMGRGELAALEPLLVDLRRPALFASIAGPALAALAERATRTRVTAPLFREGDAGDTMFVVSAGALAAVRRGTPERRIGIGDVVGELAVLTHAPRAATLAPVDGDAEVVVIDRAAFAAAARRAPELVLGLSATLAGWLAPNRPDVL